MEGTISAPFQLLPSKTLILSLLFLYSLFTGSKYIAGFKSVFHMCI